jgi:hypothetical protein
MEFCSRVVSFRKERHQPSAKVGMVNNGSGLLLQQQGRAAGSWSTISKKNTGGVRVVDSFLCDQGSSDSGSHGKGRPRSFEGTINRR